ncbi:hypothetical protein [Cognatitamlana onchidii]|uniref:hypothetical protein n=1 Tax=Cognatitamlana onchidii TaxID=2562860 RepID=UPI001F34AE4D|nr:hypothetical protein [Algibacter onchidii]
MPLWQNGNDFVMTPNDFIKILQKPHAISHEQTEGVKSIIDKYPYFQSARALYLKGLKDQSSITYNQELKVTAAYTTDRSILFDFITSDAFVQNEISEIIKQNTAHLREIEVNIEDISLNKSTAIDQELEDRIEATEETLHPDLFQPKTPDTPLKETEVPQKPTAEEILDIGKPLQFKKTETHSFNEWLKLTRFKSIERIIKQDALEPEDKTKPASEKEKKFELIDKFISTNPKIKPTKPVSQKGNLAKAQMIQPEALMTETLARIYVEQKNYKKAIQSYKILSLKYPEKSSFFANQIKAVEQLQEQNKKE